MKIETERLILRPITKKDKKDLIEGIGNIEISKYLLTVPYPYAEKDADWWINHCNEKWKEESPSSYEFVIELKSEKKMIGGTGLSHVDEYHGTAELGYWLAAKYHGKGYGSETLKAILDFAFNKLRLRRIEAKVYTHNEPSYKLLEKFGFKREGLCRESVKCKASGKIESDYMYALLKKEYKP
jgi:RimJ/RimL family protein N-acetyltransferase